jgi:hypothetical protein
MCWSVICWGTCSYGAEVNAWQVCRTVVWNSETLLWEGNRFARICALFVNLVFWRRKRNRLFEAFLIAAAPGLMAFMAMMSTPRGANYILLDMSLVLPVKLFAPSTTTPDIRRILLTTCQLIYRPRVIFQRSNHVIPQLPPGTHTSQKYYLNGYS